MGGASGSKGADDYDTDLFACPNNTSQLAPCLRAAFTFATSICAQPTTPIAVDADEPRQQSNVSQSKLSIRDGQGSTCANDYDGDIFACPNNMNRPASGLRAAFSFAAWTCGQ